MIPNNQSLVRRSLSDQRGSALVEFALTLPLLLLVLTGIFTFGIALHNYLVLTDAVNIGGQTLSIARGNTTDPCNLASSAITTAAPGLKGTFTFAFVLDGTKFNGPSCSSSSTTTGAAADLVQGEPAQVTVTYPCNLAVYGFNYAPNCVMTASIAELVQ